MILNMVLLIIMLVIFITVDNGFIKNRKPIILISYENELPQF